MVEPIFTAICTSLCPSTIHDFVELVVLSGFADYDVFICYYDGGLGHRDFTATIEVTIDPEEALCEEGPDACLEPGDTDEEIVNVY